MKRRLILTALVVGAFLAGSAGAEVAPAGDPEAGRNKFETCLGCHGIPNYKNAYPTYSVPKVGGQHAARIVAALAAYKSGERTHATMVAQASSLSEQDMKDIAAYLASLGSQ